MDAVNKKIAITISLIGLVLIILTISTELLEFMWFKVLFGLWIFIFCSSIYRLTPLFKSRNRLENFIQRDAQHLLLFSLMGFFDKKHGPNWLVIKSIERITSKDDELTIYSNNERQLCVSLPAKKAQLDSFIKRILTDSEKQTITFD
ncbi:hypothetical protein B0W48_19010 [Pseudoalteromonas aliena]|uniref:YcxB-like protein domain-containing protein n=1 Tax=Pseudoalteromonas aliena TaxID=247523 RepID=A0A1Q2H2V6_9GAMM|nr:hypothetical protein [Pseudoalteromonas aliena]AQQ01690.1 hypothetical protein B0W48_19010 [Pseudoalteromonas aliena]